jgi:hypothetical protein
MLNEMKLEVALYLISAAIRSSINKALVGRELTTEEQAVIALRFAGLESALTHIFLGPTASFTATLGLDTKLMQSIVKVSMLDHDPPKDPEALLRENLDLRRSTEELKRECDRLRAGKFVEGDFVSYGTERKYLSKRGFPLIWSIHESPVDQVITAEFYQKWYELYIVHPDGHVEELTYEKLEAYTPPGESTYRDHTPNPKAVHNFAEANNWSIDLIFWEVLRGRWKDESEL